MSLIGGITAATGLAGAALGAHSASSAAKTQAQAADQAAQLQYQLGQQNLDFTKQQYADTLRMLSPYYNTGTSALNNLSYLMGLRPSNQVLTPRGNPTLPQIPGIGGNVMPMRAGADIGRPAVQAAPLSNAMLRSGSQPVSDLPESTAPGPISTSGGVTNNAGPAEQGPKNPTDAGLMPPGFLGPPTPASGAPTGGATTLDPVTGLPTDSSFLVQLDQNAGFSSGFGSLMTPWTEQFQAPTDVTEQNDPGFQFRLQQGQDALERSAAARGSLLTGGTAKDLTNYAQDYASNEYNNVYNRALNQYQQRYNIFQQNQANQFNRLAALAGIGQTTSGQLASAGQGAAGNVNSILTNTGSQIGQQINNAGAARASGYVGAGNAWQNALGDLGMLGVLMGRSSQ